MTKVTNNDDILLLTLLKAEVPQNLNILCLQLRMALVHVAHLSIQQLAACISSLILKKKAKHHAFNSGYHGGLCCNF